MSQNGGKSIVNPNTNILSFLRNTKIEGRKLCCPKIHARYLLFEECCKNAGSSVPWISQLRTWAQTEYFTCSLHHVTFNVSAISIQWPFCSFCLLVFLNVAFNKKCFIHSKVDIGEDVEKSTLYFAFVASSNKGHYESKVESPEVILDLGKKIKKIWICS